MDNVVVTFRKREETGSPRVSSSMVCLRSEDDRSASNMVLPEMVLLRSVIEKLCGAIQKVERLARLEEGPERQEYLVTLAEARGKLETTRALLQKASLA